MINLKQSESGKANPFLTAWCGKFKEKHKEFYTNCQNWGNVNEYHPDCLLGYNLDLSRGKPSEQNLHPIL